MATITVGTLNEVFELLDTLVAKCCQKLTLRLRLVLAQLIQGTPDYQQYAADARYRGGNGGKSLYAVCMHSGNRDKRLAGAHAPELTRQSRVQSYLETKVLPSTSVHQLRALPLRVQWPEEADIVSVDLIEAVEEILRNHFPLHQSLFYLGGVAHKQFEPGVQRNLSKDAIATSFLARHRFQVGDKGPFATYCQLIAPLESQLIGRRDGNAGDRQRMEGELRNCMTDAGLSQRFR